MVEVFINNYFYYFIILLFLFIVYYLYYFINKHHFEDRESPSKAVNTLFSSETELFQVLAHDIKNPLQAITHSSQIISDKNTSPEQTRRLSKLIYDESQELIQRTDFLLQNTFVEKQFSQFQFQVIDTFEIIEKIIDIFHVQGTISNTKCDIETDSLPWYRIQGNEVLVKQIFENLIVNALQYAKPNTTIRISFEYWAGDIIIKIQNVIHPQTPLSEKLLRSFLSPLQPPNHAQGLGLYIVQKLVTLHAGTLHFEISDQEHFITTVIFPQAL